MRSSLVAALVAAALLLAGCGSPYPPTRTVVAPSPVRAAADLHCSLPVVSASHAGFIDFPSGRFREDATAPAGNRFGLAYANGAHKWVRTEYAFGYQLLSPDGTEIAEANGGPIYSGPNGPGGQGYTDIYLGNLTTLSARHVGKVPGRARIIAFRPEGLYLDAGQVYRFDVTTGKAVVIGPKPPAPANMTGLWFWATDTQLWSSLIPLPNQGDRDSVLSMSLRDGSVTSWYTAPATRSVSIIGFVTPNQPLVVEYNNEPYTSMTGVVFMVLTAPGAAPQRLALDPSIAPGGFTDSMGVWLASPGRLWLYDSTGLVSMAQPWGASGSDVAGAVGPCR